MQLRWNLGEIFEISVCHDRNCSTHWGAGYIGSHVAAELVRAGYQVVIIDDLSSGNLSLVPPAAAFYKQDICESAEILNIIAKYKPEAALHFAASVSVEESVKDPSKYYENNFQNSMRFFKTCSQSGLNKVVFSSTAAVYGIPEKTPVDETTPTRPVSPYGRSKLMSEWFLEDLSRVSPLRYVALRYFNVAGAHHSLPIGQLNQNATHLIKRATEAACGRRAGVEVYGDDYPTLDGTGVRDYIHVEDLAHAHVLALRYLLNGGASQTFNCGYGRGFSVREVLNTVQTVSGNKFEIRQAPRRAGDIPMLVANADRIRKVLGWEPRFDSLETICRTSLEWEKKNQIPKEAH